MNETLHLLEQILAELRRCHDGGTPVREIIDIRQAAEYLGHQIVTMENLKGRFTPAKIIYTMVITLEFKMENALKYLTENEVAEMTRIALPTLRNQRSRGLGIPYIKIGRSVRYSLSDVVTYMEKQKIVTLGAP